METALALMEQGANVMPDTSQRYHDTSQYDPNCWGNVHERTNRWDLKLRLCPVVEKALREILPSVHGVIDAILGPKTALVELASLISDPGAPSQLLHADTLYTVNAEMVTVFVPLQDIDEHMGPTNMLPQTHTSAEHWQKVIKNGGPEVRKRIVSDPQFQHEELGTPPLMLCTGATGTGFMMDSRLLHCGGVRQRQNPRLS